MNSLSKQNNHTPHNIWQLEIYPYNVLLLAE